jgi:type VI secretion system secreted protein VgrG
MALLGQDTLVTGPLDKGVLLLETFEGFETLGEPYNYKLTLLSTNPAIPVENVLGKPLTIHIKLDSGDYRYFHGIVTHFAKAGPTRAHTRYVAVVNPQLSLFKYTRDCRVMDEEGQTALSIVTDVLAQRGFTDVESGSIKDHTYRKRDYCVQYRESDLNFVQRLLGEEGIYYFFKHENGKHTMVLADSITAHANVPGYEAVLLRPTFKTQDRDEEHFWSLQIKGGLYPGDFTVVRGYDYTINRPPAVQFGETPSDDPLPGSDFEDYDYSGGLSEEAEAKQEALVRMQMERVANTVIEVEGNTMGLGVGSLVKLKQPLSADGVLFYPFWGDKGFDKDYLITSARYTISINQYESGDVAKSDEPFKAIYTLLDSQTQFRPRRQARKPRIEGPQTAMVVGPDGEEIYTDEFGRVKVQFDWDRLGNRDEESSCWVRVAQVWAGKQWGAIHIPRIGQEVIVEFLDGDPDRPIVTGRVYSFDNMPPYTLPDNKTQSGIKSRSSKGGTDSNFNEIRFEDLKGKEELHIQAEKDMNILVKNDETRTVGHDRVKTVQNDETTKIGGNRKEEVDKDEDISIHGKRTENVDKDEAITIGGNRTETVVKNETISINGQRAETVGKDEDVSIGGGRQVSVGKADSLTVANGRNQAITGNDQLTVSKNLIFEAGEGIVMKTGDASITMTKDGTIVLKGKDVSITASGKINATVSSDVVIKGSKVSGN